MPYFRPQIILRNGLIQVVDGVGMVSAIRIIAKRDENKNNFKVALTTQALVR